MPRSGRRTASLLPKQHIDHLFTGSETIRDVVIGMADGLNVPFVLASGVSGAIASTHIVVTAGLAEIAAGAISMGLAGFIAAKDDAKHYHRELQREELKGPDLPGREALKIGELFKDYGVTADEAVSVVAALHRKPRAWRTFMMRFDLGMKTPDPKQPMRSAATIAGSYVVCGMIPLLPYMQLENVDEALLYSVVVTLVALAMFGAVKGHFTRVSKIRCAWQTALVGSVAAGVAFGIARVIS